MNIGISSPAFALEPFSKIFDAIAEKFEFWEIVADLEQLLPDIASELKVRAPSYDIKFSVHAPFNDLNIAALNPQLRKLAVDYVKNTIKTAADLEISLVSLHPGHFCPSGVYNGKKVMETNLRSINEIAKFARDYSLSLALENMPIKNWTLGNTAEEILNMINDTELGICFDIGHAFIQNEVENFLEHVDRIYNVHIHDNDGRRDQHLILGEGAINIPQIIKTLNHNYTGNIIIESNTLEEGGKSKEILQNILQSMV